MTSKVRSYINRKRDFNKELSLWNPLFLVYIFLVNEIKSFLIKIPKNNIVVDLGCGTKPYSIFLDKTIRYIGVDIDKKNDNVDIVSSVYDVNLGNEIADYVVSFQVMEHLEEPSKMLSEAYRLLKHKGKIFITLPMSEHMHEMPYDFYRYTEYGAKYLLKKAGFTKIKVYRLGTNSSNIGRRIAQALYPHTIARIFVPIINLIFWKLDNNIGFDVMNYAFIAVKK